MFLWVTSAREFGKQRFQGVDLNARVEKQCFFGIHRGPETRKTLFTSKKMSFYPEKDRELGNNCTLFARQGC